MRGDFNRKFDGDVWPLNNGTEACGGGGETGDIISGECLRSLAQAREVGDSTSVIG